MKVITIVGARPQFIKLAPVSRALRNNGVHEVIIHTGQHYDHGMSDVFFAELDIAEPDYNLGVGSGNHGQQTGLMLARLEEVMLAEKPDWVIVFGDTNSALAGALAATKLHIPVAHVEAGLRSFNRRMAEEINRVLADHVSTVLFCPTETAVRNLANEGITRGVHLVGDVMLDGLLDARERAQGCSTILSSLGLKQNRYLLATVHRAENTDDPGRLRAILSALTQLAETEPVIFPVHPRTRKALASLGFSPQPSTLNSQPCGGLRLIEPLGYLDLIKLSSGARVVLTDSGGLQKESYWLGVPCVTLRDETEWVETIEQGWNVLAGADVAKIRQAARELNPQPESRFHRNGQSASAEIVSRLVAGKNPA